MEGTSQLHTPYFRVWLCGPFRMERWVEQRVEGRRDQHVDAAYEALRTAEWGGSNYPRLLLKALLCCPGRQARREALLDLLWPETDPEQASVYLNTATTKLRKVLQPAGQPSLLITENDSQLYVLADQDVLWVDADAALALLKTAERVGMTAAAALPPLEEAATLFNHGAFLDGEEGQWVAGRRATIEQARYRCRVWLAEVYEQQRMPGQAETTLSLLLEEDPFDEDILCRLMSLLHQQGMTHQALHFYERTLQTFEKESLKPSEATKTLVTHIQEDYQHNYRISRISTPAHGIIVKGGDPENVLLSQFTKVFSQGITLAIQALREEEGQSALTAGLNGSRRKASTDILAYKRNIRLALYLHRTSTAQVLLQNINDDIRDLEQLETQTRGHDLYDIKEMLIVNHLLATKIVKDQRQYAHAYRYANRAVWLAESLENGDLIATTTYTRGCVQFEWAQFGTVIQGVLQLNKEDVRAAIHDFQHVLNIAHVQRTPLHPQLHGFTHLQIGRAYSLLRDEGNSSTETDPLFYVDQAEDMVGKDAIEDAYTRLLMTGTLSGLHWGAYHLNKTEMYTAMGMQDQAFVELKHLQALTARTYPHDETRNQTWRNVVMAEVLMGLEAYTEATYTLRNALLACRSINSIQNGVTITDLYHRLARSSYGTSADVQEIGSMLKEWNEIV